MKTWIVFFCVLMPGFSSCGQDRLADSQRVPADGIRRIAAAAYEVQVERMQEIGFHVEMSPEEIFESTELQGQLPSPFTNVTFHLFDLTRISSGVPLVVLESNGVAFASPRFSGSDGFLYEDFLVRLRSHIPAAEWRGDTCDLAVFLIGWPSFFELNSQIVTVPDDIPDQNRSEIPAEVIESIAAPHVVGRSCELFFWDGYVAELRKVVVEHPDANGIVSIVTELVGTFGPIWLGR